MADPARTIDPAEAVELATRHHEPVIVIRDGSPLAAVLPIDLFEKWLGEREVVQPSLIDELLDDQGHPRARERDPLVSSLAQGERVETILADFPSLTDEDVRAIVAFFLIGSMQIEREAIMRKREEIKSVLETELRKTFPHDTVDVSDGYQQNIHVMVVSRKFDQMKERDRQDFLWSLIDATDLTVDEKNLISLLIPASPEMLK